MSARVNGLRARYVIPAVVLLGVLVWAVLHERLCGEATSIFGEERAETATGLPPAGLRSFPPMAESAPDEDAAREPASGGPTDEDVEVDEADPWRTAHIEEIKGALYELDIDSVEQLQQLEQFVSLGDADTRDFWNTSWNGVDDWKRRDDGFQLKALEDGTFMFIPGEETMRTYSFLETFNAYQYDEETQEFIHEVDYYGKPIQNIVKFLRNDVMVFMVVSGRKVDLSLYELRPD